MPKYLVDDDFDKTKDWHWKAKIKHKWLKLNVTHKKKE